MTDNKFLESILQCPACQGKLIRETGALLCTKCHQSFAIDKHKVLFTPTPTNIRPSELRERNENIGTPWRKANWQFIKDQMQNLPKNTLILDVGAGHGDFLEAYKTYPHVLLDVYPYPKVDVVCDLTQVNPFRKETFDVILLMNVLEHVFSPMDLLDSLRKILKPNGCIILTIPFLLKIHQAPLDFVRYTHFAIEKIAKQKNFELQVISGFYDPVGLVRETLRYYHFWTHPQLKRMHRWVSTLLEWTLNRMIDLLSFFAPKAYNYQPFETDNPAPIGYHVVFTKPS